MATRKKVQVGDRVLMVDNKMIGHVVEIGSSNDGTGKTSYWVKTGSGDVYSVKRVKVV